MNLETIHTTPPPETENLLSCDPGRIIRSPGIRQLLAISAGWPLRPSGVLAINIFSYSLPAVTPLQLHLSVSVAPGKIEIDANVFCAQFLSPKEIVMASNAAFVAEYKEAPGSGILLAPELILMTLPPLSPNSFKAAWIVSMGQVH